MSPRLITRKIVQIAATPACDDIHTSYLFALCDDGTLWVTLGMDGSKAKWEQMGAISQELNDETE